MKEVLNIIQAYHAALEEGKQVALATVVKVEGSSYRRAGARMLISEDGRLTGAISGGCLEGDALRKALLAISEKKPSLVTYDTTDEDDEHIAVQLGCNGIVHILIEPIDAGERYHPVALMEKMRQTRDPAVLVTLFSLENRKGMQPGTCLLVKGDEVLHTIEDASLAAQISTDAKQVLSTESSVIREYAAFGQLTAFIAYNPAPLSLLVFGAGNDAIPLEEMASILGWEVSIFDGRYSYATRERFRYAKNITVAKADGVLEFMKADCRTAAVLMSHNYNYDKEMLRQLIPLNLPYIGCLGPKKKLERMMADLKETGLQFNNEQQQKVFGPVGLDIRAETAEEIALSVIAEIQSVFTGSGVWHLRDKRAPIHDME